MPHIRQSRPDSDIGKARFWPWLSSERLRTLEVVPFGRGKLSRWFKLSRSFARPWNARSVLLERVECYRGTSLTRNSPPLRAAMGP